jgi:SNF2 family DNA or RNA helicase
VTVHAKRSLLALVSRKRILRLAQEFEVTAEPDALVDALANAADLEALIAKLNAKELDAACKQLEIPSSRNKRAALLATLTSDAAPTPDTAPTSDAAPRPTPTPKPPTPNPQPVGHRWRDSVELEPGQIVRVRSRQYLVERVTPPSQHGESTLVTLSCLEDDALGDPLEVLWECEIDARILGRSSWEHVAERGFDRPELFSAYLHTLRWNCVTSTDPTLFQAPYRAGIQVKDYQLEPLRKALNMPRVRLFIADDVGLGKTIEAGLILRELLMRQRVRWVVVACPPSVVQQWREEMEQRFGLTFVVVDRAWFSAIRSERGLDANPWKTHSRFIISHALLRDESYAGPLRIQLGTFAPGSLLILDEAHNVAPSSGARYAVDSHLTRTARDLAPRFEHKLFLSATPHNGHSNSFAALLEILDPQRFVRGVPVSPDQLADVMVRRLKQDLREQIPGEFALRKVDAIVVDNLPDDAPELELSRLLQQLRELRSERLAGATKGRQSAALLVLTSLQKRLLSSIEAFHRTLVIHRKAIERRASKTAAEHDDASIARLDLLREAPGSDDDRADLPEDEVAVEEDAQLEAASVGTDIDPRERALLDRMLEISTAARHQTDARFTHLLDWVRAQQCPELGQPDAAWLPRRVLIFTEYTDTKRWLEQQLQQALAGSDRANARVATFHGGMSDDGREAIKRAFNSDPHDNPLRILIATDAAREGVNLQNHCADLFHFDIPWNPGRMEQRNGRIDRKLQRATRVTCRYFVLPQRAEDKVLATLVRKTETINEELGSLTPVVIDRMARVLDRGIGHAEADELARSIDAVDPHSTPAQRVIQGEFEAVRKRRQALGAEIDTLRTMLERAREAIGLDHRHFRDALSSALELVGAPKLAPVDAEAALADPSTAVWQFPPLDQRVDSTWVDTLDTLRPARERNQKLWDWRRDAAIRPVVFKATEHLDEDVVHLHLEHRVVRRLLGRFLAQGFVHDELSRACVCLSEDAEPKIIALGRLSLYGDRATRLHDEIIPIVARWREPEQREQAKGRSKLDVLDAVETREVLVQLEHSLLEKHLRDAPTPLADRLRRFAAHDVEALLPDLERRSKQVASTAERQLVRRGEQEAKAMTRILEDQRRRIEEQIAKLDKPQPVQLSLDLQVEEEQRQLAADRRYWPKRLAQLQDELTSEPAKIRRTYEIRARRIDPVGLVYLWPVSS